MALGARSSIFGTTSLFMSRDLENCLVPSPKSEVLSKLPPLMRSRVSLIEQVRHGTSVEYLKRVFGASRDFIPFLETSQSDEQLVKKRDIP